MSYVIICDKRDFPETKLFMVDRSKIKSTYWSDEMANVMQFHNLKVATDICAKLQYNNPKVITLGEAYEIANRNHELINSQGKNK